MRSRTERAQHYRPWIIGPEATRIRAQAAYQLSDAITSRSFSDQTFEDIIIILNHDFLCVKLGQKQQDDEIRSLDAPFINFEPALTINFVDGLLETLSGPLIRSCSDIGYATYELQFRALLATFTLLQSLRVTAFHRDFYDKFQNSLRARFQNLEWHPENPGESPGDLMQQKYLKIECSYLLSATAEYFRHFNQARPLFVAVASRAINLLAFGVAVAQPALGLGAGNLVSALTELNGNLRAISQEPNRMYTGLFTLQGLTRLAQALELLDLVIDDWLDTKRIRERLDYFTQTTLANISTALSIPGFENYQNNFSPPPETLIRFQAATSRGPPSFNKYFYIYGLVDCAVQVGKIRGLEYVPDELSRRLTTVAVSECESSHRWKALKFILSSAGSKDGSTAESLLQMSQLNFRERLCREIRCLFPNIHSYIVDGTLQTRASRSGSSNDSTRPSIAGNLPAVDWMEAPFSLPDMEGSCTKHAIRTRKLIPKTFLEVGLSPDCKAMFTLDEDSVCIYDISSLEGSRDMPKLARKEGSRNESFTQAALSDRYVATMSHNELRISMYLQGTASNKKSAILSFERNKDNCQFFPRCMALLDGRRRTWVAVAGEYSTSSPPNTRNGGIRIYKVKENDTDSTVISQTGASFNGPAPHSWGNILIDYIDFCPSGRRLVAVTHDNVVLVWSLSSNMERNGDPIRISRPYAADRETIAQGVTSATLFQSPSSKPYVLCTTWRSSECIRNGGERSYILPIATHSTQSTESLLHEIVRLDKAGPIIASAASPDGKFIAVVEKTGEVSVLPLRASRSGGLKTADTILLSSDKLKDQDKASASSMRFRYSNCGLELFVVDNHGKMLRKRFEGTERLLAAHLQRLSIATAASIG